MQNNNEEIVNKIASFNGIDVYSIKADKFKTNTINIYLHDDLTKENVTLNALLPAVLRRGTAQYQSYQEIALYLESLYGAAFDCGVSKKGERHTLQFYIDYISDKYAEDNSQLFNKCFNLLFDILTNPFLENGAFKKEYVELEKENVKNLIEGRVNDKVQYAVDKCYEVMCKDERYGIYEYGMVEELKNITPEDLYKYYIKCLETLPISVFITGNIEEDQINSMIKALKGLTRGNIKTIGKSVIYPQNGEVKNVIEKMSINQGKLSLGFRTSTEPDAKDYYTLLVYNGILGGGVHSKLFQNVREKESLCYYAFSRLERYKGLMMISSGIEIQNRDKAYDIIMQQLKDIENGNISDYELDSTVKSIETGLKSMMDSQMQIVEFYLGQTVTQTNDTFETIMEKVRRVKKQDVVEVSKKIKLDTIYFLTSN